jgi:hypothetical protein
MKTRQVLLNVSLAVALGLTLTVGFLASIGEAAPPAKRLTAPGNPTPDPPVNSHAAPATATISIAYDQAIDSSTVSTHTFAIFAAQTGLLTQTYTVDGGTISVTPLQPLKPGEFVQASATTGTLSLVDGLGPSAPTVWQFRARATRGTGVFSDSFQRLGTFYSIDGSLGDLDGDGDLDAFVGNSGVPNRVWLNDGSGTFSDSGQTLGISRTRALALGDLDGDGDLDAFAGNALQANVIWLNDGSGLFADSGQALGSDASVAVALGDVDGDGDLDAFVGNGGPYGAYANKVWFNDGAGLFADSGQALGSGATGSVALGDVDGDGDLDAFVGDRDAGNRVWLNDGSGTFADSGQALGSSDTRATVLGDVDGDGDLDALVGNFGTTQINGVWLNNGSGAFTDSGQSLPGTYTEAVALGDVDGDGDLDALLVNSDEANYVWLNDGTGAFADSGQTLVGNTHNEDIALGDVDSDGDLDIFVANGGEVEPNWVWLNNKSNPIARDDYLAVPPESSGNALDVLANDGDPDGDDLTIDAVGTPSNGSADTDGTVITYTPDAGFNGLDVFSYTVRDPGFLTDTAILTVSVGAGNPPVAQGDAAATDEDTLVTIDVLANDSDPEGQTFVLASVTTPAHGTAAIDTNRVVYTPSPDVHGEDTFTYVVSDGWFTDTAGVTVTVSPVEDAPTLDTIPDRTIPEDASTQTILLSGITSGAPNEAQTLSLAAQTVVNGDVVPHPVVTYTSPNADAVLGVTPLADQFGSAKIEVTVSDGVSQTTRSFWITVDPVNDPPLFTLPAGLTVSEDAGLQTVTMTGVDYGPTNENTQRPALAFTATSMNPAVVPQPHITYDNDPGQYTSGSLSFAPVADAYGASTIVVTLTDGLSETVQTLPATITPVNDPPTLDAIPALQIDEDSGPHVVDLSGIGPGAANESQTLVVTAAATDTVLVPDPTVGYVSPDTIGTLTLAPAVDRFGAATVLVTVTDGFSTTLRSFPITVNPVNDPPTLAPIPDVSLEQGGSAATVTLSGITAGSYESQPLAVTAATADPSLLPTVVLTYASPSDAGELALTPTADDFGVSTVAVTVTDGLAQTGRTFSAIVNPIFRFFSADPGSGGLVPRSGPFAATCTRQIAESSVHADSVSVHGAQTGLYAGSTSVDTTPYDAFTFGEIAFTPKSPFKPGEVVRVTLGQALQSVDGKKLATPYTWQFRAATHGGLGAFDVAETHQVYPSSGLSFWQQELFQPQSVLDSQAVALGDLDGDGDLDAYVVRNDARTTVWFNDGTGAFSDSGQTLGQANSWAIALGDLDSDGDLDAFVGNYDASDTVWLNDGTGIFSDSGQSLGASDTYAIALGDLDGDGDLDAATGSDLGQPAQIWLNDGSGAFSDSGQYLGFYDTRALALGDLDNDGDLDAFLGIASGRANRIWLNGGGGTFADTGQRLGAADTHAVALGDLDSDGDLDAFVGNMDGEPDEIWLNDGSGAFSDSGQRLGTQATWTVRLGDVNSDGSLDAFTGQVAYGLVSDQENRVWLNDGSASFIDSGQQLGAYDSLAVALGDVDGDGDLDAFVGNSNGLWQPNVVYRNRTISILIDAERGGTLSYGDEWFGETTVVIPPGAVSLPTEIRYASRADLAAASSASTLQDRTFALDAYRDGDRIASLPLSVPMTITLRYEDAAIEGLDEGTLELHHWDGEAWTTEEITVAEHDAARNRLIVEAMRTAKYALVGQPKYATYLPLVARQP